MSAPKGNTYNNKYQPEFVTQVYKLCLLNATDEEIADFFDVCRDTIYNWDKQHPEFSDARRNGKILADAEVTKRLYCRAVGMTITKQKVLNTGEIVQFQEELPPETRAMEFWLQSRQREKWSPKQKVELSGDSDNPLAFILDEIASSSTNPLPFQG